MSIRTGLIILSVICFGLGAFGASGFTPNWSWDQAGKAFGVAAFLF